MSTHGSQISQTKPNWNKKPLTTCKGFLENVSLKLLCDVIFPSLLGQFILFICLLLSIIIYLMLTFVIYKWYINNLPNTMIVKTTTIFSIANLSQPDTLI